MIVISLELGISWMCTSVNPLKKNLKISVKWKIHVWTMTSWESFQRLCLCRIAKLMKMSIKKSASPLRVKGWEGEISHCTFIEIYHTPQEVPGRGQYGSVKPHSIKITIALIWLLSKSSLEHHGPTHIHKKLLHPPTPDSWAVGGSAASEAKRETTCWLIPTGGFSDDQAVPPP